MLRSFVVVVLLLGWTCCWINSRYAGDLKHHDAVIWFVYLYVWGSSLKMGQSYDRLPWWRHQMEAFSALLGFCARYWVFVRWIPRESASDVFFDVCLNKRLYKQSRLRWFETPSRSLWRHCNDCGNHTIECPSASEFIQMVMCHDNVMKWEHFPRYWPFVRGNHQSPGDSPDKGQRCGALMFPMMCAQTSVWANTRCASSLWRHCNAKIWCYRKKTKHKLVSPVARSSSALSMWNKGDLADLVVKYGISNTIVFATGPAIVSYLRANLGNLRRVAKWYKIRKHICVLDWKQ